MRTWLIIVPLLSSLFIKAQITISTLSLTDTSQNIFYVGVDNFIKISGKQFSHLNQSVVITGGGGMMIPKGLGTYIIRVQKETDNCSMWINENGKRIFKKDFKVRNLGFPPQANINGYKDTAIALSQLLADPVLQILIPDCLYQLSFSVSSYKAVIRHGKESIEMTVSKNKMTGEQLKMLNDLEAGDEIFFHEIIASTGSFQSIKCLPFKITIKNP